MPQLSTYAARRGLKSWHTSSGRSEADLWVRLTRTGSSRSASSFSARSGRRDLPSPC